MFLCVAFLHNICLHIMKNSVFVCSCFPVFSVLLSDDPILYKRQNSIRLTVAFILHYESKKLHRFIFAITLSKVYVLK